MKQYPDLEFGRRYKETLTYGFWLETDANRARIQQLFSTPSEDWVILNLNPKEISVSMPYATDVAIMQGGGKLVESNGQLIREITISGSNGFLPVGVAGHAPRVRERGGSLVDLSEAAEEDRIKRSGFLAFHRFKFLFEKYGELRKNRKHCTLHWFNLKDDEFFVVEPESFDYRKGAGGPFLYEYTVRFKAIDEVKAESLPVRVGRRPDVSVLSEIPLPLYSPGIQQDSGVRQIRERLADLVTNGTAFVNQVTGEANQGFQTVLTNVGNVLNVLNDVADTASSVLDTAINMVTQTIASIEDCVNTVFRFAPSNVQEALNEALLEMDGWMIHLQDFLITSFSSQQARSARTMAGLFVQSKALAGTESDLMPEVGIPLQSNPLLNQLGLTQVFDQAVLSSAVRSEFVREGDTIYTLAARLLGDVTRFIEIIALNDLSAPYIVSGSGVRPSNTIAWGESILIPTAEETGVHSQAIDAPSSSSGGYLTAVTTTSEITDTVKSLPWRENQWVGYTVTMTSGAIYSSGDNVRYVVSNTADVLVVNQPWPVIPALWDTYTIQLEYLDIRRPEEQNDLQAFGTDLLLSFVRKQGTVYPDFKADLVLDHKNDLALARKRANFEQSVLLRTTTELGSNMYAPQFGILSPVGRRFDLSTVYLYLFFLRRSFLRDPRVAFVGHNQFSVSGTELRVDLQVRPRSAKRSSTVTVRL